MTTTTVNKTRSTMDGVDHINILSAGKTEVGRALAYTSKCPITIPGIGPFNSMEGFLWFIRTPTTTEKDIHKRNLLRGLSGQKARNVGKGGDLIYIKGYKELVEYAIYCKVSQNENIRKLVAESTLPFELYWIDMKSNKEVYPNGWEWQVRAFERVRKHIKDGTEPPCPNVFDLLTEVASDTSN